MSSPNGRDSGVATIQSDAWEYADVEAATDVYAARFAGPVGAWFLDVQAFHTLSLLPPAPLRMLDVGGGHAQLAPHLINAGHDVTVLGSQPSCAQRLDPWLRDGRCRFEVGNLAEMPYVDDSFDVVLAFRMLAHVADWRGFMSELCRVARLAVIVDYPSVVSANVFSGPLFRLKKGAEKNTRPFRLLTPGQVRAAFRDHGFTVACTRSQFFMPMVLYRALGSMRLVGALEKPASWLGLTRLFGSPVIVRADRCSGPDTEAGES